MRKIIGASLVAIAVSGCGDFKNERNQRNEMKKDFYVHAKANDETQYSRPVVIDGELYIAQGYKMALSPVTVRKIVREELQIALKNALDKYPPTVVCTVEEYQATKSKELIKSIEEQLEYAKEQARMWDELNAKKKSKLKALEYE